MYKDDAKTIVKNCIVIAQKQEGVSLNLDALLTIQRALDDDVDSDSEVCQHCLQEYSLNRGHVCFNPYSG